MSLFDKDVRRVLYIVGIDYLQSRTPLIIVYLTPGKS